MPVIALCKDPVLLQTAVAEEAPLRRVTWRQFACNYQDHFNSGPVRHDQALQRGEDSFIFQSAGLVIDHLAVELSEFWGAV